jgi:DNA-directed RNA polymerase subunit RPC12/RpoP
MEFDTLFNKERQYVLRDNWEDECECENFIPKLSESNGDYELEAIYTFCTSFECPFCGSTVYVMDLGIEETAIITCDECGKHIAVKGKEI